MNKRKLQAEALAEEAADTASWPDCTVTELKLELEARGLSKFGRKADLAARLEASDNGTYPLTSPLRTRSAKRSNPAQMSKLKVLSLQSPCSTRM